MRKIFLILVALASPFSFGQEEGFAYHGYARGSVGVNVWGKAISTEGAFTAPGAYGRPRFGNEMNYSEHTLQYTGLGYRLWWKVQTTLALEFPGFPEGWHRLSQSSDNDLILAEAFATIGWVDGGPSFWVGNRYDDSINLDMYDYYINDLSSSYGYGADNIGLGPVTLSLAYLVGYDESAHSGRGGTIHSFVFRPSITFEGGGTLGFKIVPSLATGPRTPRGGAIVETTFSMDSFFTLLEGNIEFFGYYDFGTGVNDSSYAFYNPQTIRTGLGFQGGVVVNDLLSCKFTALGEAKMGQVPDSGIWLTSAFRPYFRLGDFWGIALEGSYDYFRSLSTGDPSHIGRLTLAPTLTLDKENSVFSNPTFYIFTTYAIGDARSDVVIPVKDYNQALKFGAAFTVNW